MSRVSVLSPTYIVAKTAARRNRSNSVGNGFGHNLIKFLERGANSKKTAPGYFQPKALFNPGILLLKMRAITQAYLSKIIRLPSWQAPDEKHADA